MRARGAAFLLLLPPWKYFSLQVLIRELPQTLTLDLTGPPQGLSGLAGLAGPRSGGQGTASPLHALCLAFFTQHHRGSSYHKASSSTRVVESAARHTVPSLYSSSEKYH